MDYPAWLAGESQAAENSDMNCLDNTLLCNELLDSSSLLKSSVNNQVPYTGSAHGTVEMTGNNDASCGISVLENLEFDTPPDLPLAVSFSSHPPPSICLPFKCHRMIITKS